MTYQQHPLSAAFPAMNAEEFQDLLNSITDIGIQNPITIFEGMVLDGWNRYRAASELGYDCPERLYEGADPVRFVKAQNKHRRHMNVGAWALVEVALSAWQPVGRPNKDELSSPFRATNEQMAANVGATVRTIQHAKVVHASAVPAVKAAVQVGAVSVKEAASIAKLPEPEQAAALRAPKPQRAKGRPKKVPAGKLVDAQIKIAQVSKAAEGAEEKASALEAEIAALREQLAEANDDNTALGKLIESSDPLAAALADAKASRDLARALQQRINSMLTEIAELSRSVKHWQKKAGVTA